MKLPGGNRAVKEIWRIAAALLKDAGLEAEDYFPDKNTRGISAMLDAGLNCPLSSGMGRLFDGVCAMIGLREAVSYEGQGAVLLEAKAAVNCERFYPVEVRVEKGVHVFDTRSMIREICAELRAGIRPEEIAAAFMNTLVKMALVICKRIRLETGLNRVVLSGGVFQNMYLLERMLSALEESDFDAYFHHRVSANDEGISFGQIAIAENGGGANVPCSTPENYTD